MLRHARGCSVVSGGGYRAMLFHAGALVRLNELGWLPHLDRVSSVSGGSITAGVLASRWDQLAFDESGSAPNLRELGPAPNWRTTAAVI